MGRIHGYSEFSFRSQEYDRDAPGSGRDDNFQEAVFEQRLRVDTRGYIYHPNLLELSLGALVGLQQWSFDQLVGNGTDKDSRSGTIVEYDIEGMAFKQKKYPFSFSAHRARSLAPRPFRSSIETLSETLGLSLQYVDEKMPTRLQFTRTEVDLDPYILAGEAKGRQEHTIIRLTSKYIFNKYNVLNLTYDFDSTQEEPFAYRYDKNEVRLLHQLDFGEEHNHRLESELSYLKQGGTFESTIFEWRELLSLRHSDTLRSSWRFRLTDRTQGSTSDIGTLNEESYFVAGTLEHKLYDSLVSRFSADLQRQDFDSGLDIRRTGVGVDFAYTKTNQWGVLRANYRIRSEVDDRRGGDQRLEVIDEERTLRDSEPIILSDPNIERGSIMLLRQDRTELYQEGRDYRIRAVGDRLELERVPTGSIQTGETVLMSYRFMLPGSLKLDTLYQFLFFRQEFDFGLTPYLEFRRQDQTLLPKNSTGLTPEDIRANKIGAEYRNKSLRLSAEIEDYGSNVSPFEAIRTRIEYTKRFENRSTAVLAASWSDIRYGGVGPGDTQLLTIEGQGYYPVSQRMTVEGSIAYRKEDDTFSGDDDGIDVNLSLQWKYRKTELSLDYQFGRFEDDFARQDSSTLFVRVRRHF